MIEAPISLLSSIIDPTHKYRHRAPSISQVLSRNGWETDTLFTARIISRAVKLTASPITVNQFSISAGLAGTVVEAVACRLRPLELASFRIIEHCLTWRNLGCPVLDSESRIWTRALEST
jgi:hypothetical protein